MKKEPFLPEVPEWWSDVAAFEGKEGNSYGAYHIGHVVWQQFRLRKTAVGLKLPTVALKEKGFSRRYVSTALKVLEAAGLVKLTRFDYKSPEITLITDETEARKLRDGFNGVSPAAQRTVKVIPISEMS